MTYNVFGGTLSLTQSINQSPSRIIVFHYFIILFFISTAENDSMCNAV